MTRLSSTSRRLFVLATCLCAACSDDGTASPTSTIGDTGGPGSTGDPSGGPSSAGTTGGEGSEGTSSADETTGAQTETGGETGTIPPDALVIGGPEGDYPDFTSAIADWADQSVPAGGLRFAVTAGEYDERIVVPAFAGASADSPVEFRVYEGEAALVGAGSGEPGEAMIRMESSDWVIFDGVDIRDDSGAVELGVHLVGTEDDGLEGNVVRNASIALSSVAASRGIQLDSGKTMLGLEGLSTGNRFENLDIDRVGSGIQLLGPAPDDIFSPPLYESPDTGNAIVGCTFGAGDGIGHSEDTTSFAINVSNQAQLSITDNVFANVSVEGAAPTVPAGASAISLDGAAGLVARNRIERVQWSGQGGSSVNGIRSTVLPGETLDIVNNFVAGLTRGTDYVGGASDNSVYARGIWVFRCFGCEGAGGVANVTHNSVHVSLPAGRSYPVAGFVLSGGSSGQVDAVLRNNVFWVEGLSDVATGLAYAVVDGNTARDWLDADANVLWATGPGGILGQIGRELGGTPQQADDIVIWQTISGGGVDSVQVDVEFADAAAGDLHLAGASTSDAALQMFPVPGVDDDVDGDPRGAMPFAGADEP